MDIELFRVLINDSEETKIEINTEILSAMNVELSDIEKHFNFNKLQEGIGDYILFLSTYNK